MTNLTLTATSSCPPHTLLALTLATCKQEALRDTLHWVLVWPDWPSVLIASEASALHPLQVTLLLCADKNKESRDAGRQKEASFPQSAADED